MGHHFVPQAYLRGFEDPTAPGSIWTHVRSDPAPRLAPIKTVAQSRGFYDADTEVDLARLVEGPVNPLLAKLRAGRSPDPEERLPLALYIATMVKRVPKGRERGRALIQPALESTVAQLREEILEIGRLGHLDPELAGRRLREVDAAYAKFSESPPDEVLGQIRDPRPTSALVHAILGMTWRWIRAPAEEFFVTSDNPAFFHGAYGIGTPKSELRFPVSPTLALHGTWTQPGRHDPVFTLVGRDWVREFNRSLAYGASSLAFAHRRSPWLRKLLSRKDPYLFHLQWTP